MSHLPALQPWRSNLARLSFQAFHWIMILFGPDFHRFSRLVMFAASIKSAKKCHRFAQMLQQQLRWHPALGSIFTVALIIGHFFLCLAVLKRVPYLVPRSPKGYPELLGLVLTTGSDPEATKSQITVQVFG